MLQRMTTLPRWFASTTALALVLSFICSLDELTVGSARAQVICPCPCPCPPPVINQGRGGQAGIVIDSDGVLQAKLVPDVNGQLMRERVQQARAALAGDVAQPSKLRKISLNRLEQALKAAGNNPTDEMKYLAGLMRVRYVFCYPESGDIVLAGPAEGWVTDLSGRTVGMQSGRPMIELQDLAAALRVYPPDRIGGGPVIGCSIDPTPEGLAKMQSFLKQIGGQATPNDTQAIVDGLRTSLGLQKVRILGVSPDTHFAQVLVEADYRMKLIAIGLEPPETQLTTFIQRATTSISRNALIRWYFVPNYQCLRAADDGLAMELVGGCVKLVGENEVVQADGTRAASTGSNGASLAFTASFTKNYLDVARRKPVYSQLRNLVDMSIAAAYLQKNDFYGKAGWKADVLLDESKFPIQTHQAPVQVGTVVTSVWKGNRLLTPVAGGVDIRAHHALKSENMLADEGGKTDGLRQGISVKDLKPGQWWWD